MAIITILILLVIIVILYLCYVLYDNYQKKDKQEEFISKITKKKINVDKKIIPKSIIKKPNKKLGDLLMKIMIDNKEKPIKIRLYDDIVPLTCKNFRVLARKGIRNKTYKNAVFHRIIKNFMIQGGDIMNGDGTGSISIFGDNFEDEIFKIKHDQKGLLSMAKSGPDTNGSQFFITTVTTPHLDDKHVVFGKVIEGMDIIHEIENLPTDTDDRPYQKVFIKEIIEV